MRTHATGAATRPRVVVHLSRRSVRNLWLTELIACTDRHRWRPILISLEPTGQLQRDVADAGAESAALDSLRYRAFPIGLARLWRIVRRNAPAVIHSHLFDANVLASPLRRVGAVPLLVITRHEPPDFIRLAKIPRWKRAVVRAAARATYATADAVIAPSQQTVDELREEGVPDLKLWRIPIGLDTRKIDLVPDDEIRRVRSELGLSEGLSAITIARLSWEKNLALLIRVWREVRLRHGGAKLVVVGDGEEGSRLRHLALELGLEGSVLFVGQRPDVYALLRAVDLMIHVSRTESTGMVMLEALAAGKPLVATPVGIVGEHVKDGEHCLVVPHEDERATLDAIDRVVQDAALRSRLVRQGRDLIEGTFSMRTMSARYTELYDALLNDRGRR